MANAFDRKLIELGGGAPPPVGGELTPQQVGLRNRALLNAAQAILEMDPRREGESTGQLFLRAGTSGLNEFADEYSDGVKQARANEMADMEMKLKKAQFARTIALEEARKNAPVYGQTGTPDGGNAYTDWLRKSANFYMKNGFTEKGMEFMSKIPLSNPQDRQKFIREERKEHKKQVEALRDANQNFNKIANLIKMGEGQADFSALIISIQSLDDSVVRDSERKSYSGAAGRLTQLQMELNKFKDGKAPINLVKTMYDVARQAYAAAETSYGYYVADQTKYYDQNFGPNLSGAILDVPTFAPIEEFTEEELLAYRENRSKSKNVNVLSEFGSKN